MAVDQQILVSGTTGLPLSYTVPNAIEAALLCVNATIDGTNAASAFLATVEIISDGGVVVARCPCFSSIAAGASAEISWFRLRTPSATTDATTSPYQGLIISTPGIRSYWPLDETTGTTWFDLGPSTHNLIQEGSPAIGQPPLILTGKSGVFTGTTHGFGQADMFALTSVGYGVWPGDNSFSIECWYEGTFSGASNPFFVSMDDTAFRLFQFFMTGTGKVDLITFTTGPVVAAEAVSAATVNDGVRHHLVGTWSGTSFTAKVYVDGALSGSAVGPSSYSTNTPQLILAALDVGGLFTRPLGGTVDEVALYSTELTATQVHQHFVAGTT